MTAPPDPLPLSDGEREVLLLLAEGHTAKTIAVAIGRSVGAVNERLREARRKTGVGSSRELARLLVARENWDKQIGVARETVPAPDLTLPTSHPERRRWSRRMTMLTVAGIAAMAALAVQVMPDERAGRQLSTDPAFGELLSAANAAPHELHARVASEIASGTDREWADATEAQMLNLYGPVAFQNLAVRCSATLCEVLIEMPSEADPAQIEAAMTYLQGEGLPNEIRSVGLELKSGPVGFGRGPAGQMLSAGYWERVPGK